jgi:hypothetical protein
MMNVCVTMVTDEMAPHRDDSKVGIGKTAPTGNAPSFDLTVGERVRIEPIVPRWQSRPS